MAPKSPMLMKGVRGAGREDSARFCEAHHRIANNLALIAGFVRLQASGLGREGRSLSAAEARLVLEEIGVRIETVGRLHRLLSANPASGEVNIGDYLEDTCQVLAESISFDSPTELFCDAGSCETSPEVAGLIGLIVTELVTNAVKYAHPAGAPGRIVVRCHEDGEGALRLSVGDDGIGLPEGFDPDRDGGLGLRVVRSLAAQLGADLEFEAAGLGLTVNLVLATRDHGPRERLSA
jgi:two-component sensor histidine kinase